MASAAAGGVNGKKNAPEPEPEPEPELKRELPLVADGNDADLLQSKKQRRRWLKPHSTNRQSSSLD